MLKSFKSKLTLFIILIGLLPLLSGVLVTIFFAVGNLSTNYLIWMVTTITTALIFVIGVPFSKVVGRPIAQVTAVCNEIVSGTLPARLEIEAQDELGVLSESLNKMAAFLQATKVELDDSRRRYQALMEEANDAIILIDTDSGRIIEANKKSEELTGYTRRELSGLDYTDIHPAAEAKRLVKLFRQVQSEGRGSFDDLVLVKKDGGLAWVDARNSLIKYKNGSVVQTILRDNTDRKRKFILSEKEISFIHEMSRVLPLFQDFDKVLDEILNKLAVTLNFNAFVLAITENEKTKVLVFTGKNESIDFYRRVKKNVTEILTEINSFSTPGGVSFKLRRRSFIHESKPGGDISQIMLPLSIAEGMAGLFSDQPDTFDKEDISLFSTLVSGLSSIYIAYKAYCQVRELSVTDALTGLYNRRKFFHELEREVERSSRYHSKFSLIILDIDLFKNINDTFGHQAGDTVLRRLAKILRDSTRKTDIIARYGGEEFIILLTETGIAGAVDVATRINQRVAAEEILTNAGIIKATVSLGVAEYTTGDASDTLISRADKALYQAKRNGRNRIERLAKV